MARKTFQEIADALFAADRQIGQGGYGTGGLDADIQRVLDEHRVSAWDAAKIMQRFADDAKSENVNWRGSRLTVRRIS